MELKTEVVDVTVDHTKCSGFVVIKTEEWNKIIEILKRSIIVNEYEENKNTKRIS